VTTIGNSSSDKKTFYSKPDLKLRKDAHDIVQLRLSISNHWFFQGLSYYNIICENLDIK